MKSVNKRRIQMNQPESEIDKKWAPDASRRFAELRTDQVLSIPGDEVFAKAWKKFEA